MRLFTTCLSFPVSVHVFSWPGGLGGFSLTRSRREATNNAEPERELSGALPSHLLIAECLHAIRNPSAERRFHCLGQCENTKVAWRRASAAAADSESDGSGQVTQPTGLSITVPAFHLFLVSFTIFFSRARFPPAAPWSKNVLFKPRQPGRGDLHLISGVL